MRFLSFVLLGLMCLLGPARAQGYPERPIRLIVPSPAGGGIEILGRQIGQHLTARWHQNVVVDARPGATGIIGTAIAAKAAPDGHTLLFAWTPPLTINPVLYESIPYDVQRDFVAVIRAATTPHVLVVKPDTGLRTVEDFVAHARRLEGKATYGSSGIGGTSHLAGELFASMAGVRMTHVPYKGTPPALVDIMAGRIDSSFSAVAPALPHVRANRLRAIAVTTPGPTAMLPGVPTVAESLRGFEAETWYGLLAPAGTPKQIVTALNREVQSFLSMPGTLEKLHAQGYEPIGGTPQDFARFLKAETQKWRKIIKSAGIRPQ